MVSNKNENKKIIVIILLTSFSIFSWSSLPSFLPTFPSFPFPPFSFPLPLFLSSPLDPSLGIIPSLRQIGVEEGAKGYFKGNGTNVVRIVPYVAVQFAAYEEFKQVGVVIITNFL